jgi:aminoglycoside phosphotransferase (APT) family kinase protein
VTPADLRPRAEAVLRRTCGGRVSVETLTPLSGGAASMTYAVAATRDGARWPLVLQCASAEGATLSRAVQARLIRLAALHGIAVPEIVAVAEPGDGLGDALFAEWLDGEALPPRWLRAPEYAAARDMLTGDCAAALARLHAIPLVAAADITLPRASAAETRAAMFDLYRSFGVNSPVFDLAFAWLSERMPATAPAHIIHGDFRSGNLLIGPAGLTAVLDWELAHLGDRHEDLAWICVNAWRFGEWRNPVGGFGDREAFYAAYEAAGGAAVERDLARIFELWGTLRWGVMCLQMANAHLTGAVPSVERAAIGRRVSENEADILHILKHGSV